MIAKLSKLTSGDKESFGNKAVLLGELLKVGIKVPNGFAISANAFTEFLNYNNFAYTPQDYLGCNENIMELILNGDFPERIKDSLEKYYYSMNSEGEKKSFAVRSSATCEDSESHSMAGVFSSFIYVNSYSDMLESIKKCYASIFSDKALSMMLHNNIPFSDLNMAIIVQEFVAGDISGVAFSADTVKMDSDIIIINTVKGICANYVDGKYPSSMYRVCKSNGIVTDSYTNAHTPVLTDCELKELYNGVLFIENLFGDYQDIEWTFKDSNLYILQARPITTFRSRQFPESWFMAENMNDTLNLFEDKALPPLQQEIRNIWSNATGRGLEYSSKGRNWRSRIINGYFYSAVDERDWDKRAKFRSWLENLLVEGKNIFQDIQLPQIIVLREELKQLFDNEQSARELLHILEKSNQLFELSVEANISAVDGGIVPLEAFEKYCKDIDSNLSQEDFYDLIFGVSILSKERERVINLSLLVKASKELIDLFDNCHYDEILYYRLKNMEVAKDLLKAIDDYIKEFGMVTVNGQWQFDSAILLEKPWVVVGKIRACLDINSELFFKSREKSLRNKESVINRMTSNMNNNEKDEFFKSLKSAEKAFLVNDDHCFYLDLTAYGYLRLALINIANLVCSTGVIKKSEDIYFLTFDEIMDILNVIQRSVSSMNYNNKVESRKDVYKKQKQIVPPAYVGIPPSPQIADEPQSKCENVTIIKGVSGLSKKVSGNVKVITDNNNIRLQEPVILVLKHGHSCYFLPHLNKIKGLVYDGGSPYDHPGIIARELSIPSLYNTQNATKVLKDGDEVELDGVDGCVILKSRGLNSQE